MDRTIGTKRSPAPGRNIPLIVAYARNWRKAKPKS